MEEGEADDEYDSASADSEKSRSDVAMECTGEEIREEERRAAWSLIQLSMRDGENVAESLGEGHRGKRKRASSL